MHIVQTEGVGLVGADFGEVEDAVVEAGVLLLVVHKLVGIADGLGVDAGDGELLHREIGEVGVLGEVVVELAVVHRGVGAGAAGVFPLGLGGEADGAAGLGREPRAEGLGGVEGDADGREVGAVDEVAASDLVLVVHVVNTVLEGGVELLHHCHRGLGGGHIEGLGDGGDVGGGFGVALGVRAHHEGAGGDAHGGDDLAAAEVELNLLARALLGLTVEGPALQGDFGLLDARTGGALEGDRAGLVGVDDALGVEVEVGGLLLVAAALVDDVLAAAALGPGAEVGDVEVDPGDQAVPLFGGELHALVALLEVLIEVGGGGVELQGREDVVVALGAVAADVGVQGDVGAAEAVPAAGAVGEVGDLLADGVGGLGLAVVAADALAVEDGLDLAVEAPAARRAVPGLNLLGLLARGDGGDGRRGHILALVAADAADGLARHPHEPRTHHLQCLAIFIERLDGEGRIGRELEHARAVFLHIHGAVEDAHVPRAFHPDGVVAAGVARSVFVVEDAQLLHLAVGDAFQGLLAAVDVGHIDIAGLALEVDAVGADGRLGAGLEGNRLVVVRVGAFPKGEDVIVDVHEDQAPGGGVVILHRGEDELVVERTGMEEVGLDVVDQAVQGDVLDWAAAEGELVDGALGLDTALGDVEHHQLALAGHAVVAGDDTDELGGAAGDVLVVEDGVGPVAVRAVELLLVGAVGVHRHQHAREVVGRVGVLPAQEDHAAVGVDLGVPVDVLVKGEAARALAVGREEQEVGHIVAAGHAGHALEADGGGGDDAPVGQIAGIEVVDVGVRVLVGLVPIGAIDVHFVEAPGAFLLVARGEEDAAGIPIELHIAEVGARALEDGGLTFGGIFLAERPAQEGVAVAAQRGVIVAIPAGVALVVLEEPLLGALRAVDEEDLLKVHRRVLEEDLLLQFAVSIVEGLSVALLGLQTLLERVDARGNLGGIRVGLGILLGIGLERIAQGIDLNRAHQRGNPRPLGALGQGVGVLTGARALAGLGDKVVRPFGLRPRLFPDNRAIGVREGDAHAVEAGGITVAAVPDDDLLDGDALAQVDLPGGVGQVFGGVGDGVVAITVGGVAVDGALGLAAPGGGALHGLSAKGHILPIGEDLHLCERERGLILRDIHRYIPRFNGGSKLSGPNRRQRRKECIPHPSHITYPPS